MPLAAPFQQANARALEFLLLADFVAKVATTKLDYKELQQSNRGEWIFESGGFCEVARFRISRGLAVRSDLIEAGLNEAGRC